MHKTGMDDKTISENLGVKVTVNVIFSVVFNLSLFKLTYSQSLETSKESDSYFLHLYTYLDRFWTPSNFYLILISDCVREPHVQIENVQFHPFTVRNKLIFLGSGGFWART